MNAEQASRLAVQATISDIRYMLESWQARTIPVTTVQGWLRDLAQAQGLEPASPAAPARPPLPQ